MLIFSGVMNPVKRYVQEQKNRDNELILAHAKEKKSEHRNGIIDSKKDK